MQYLYSHHQPLAAKKASLKVPALSRKSTVSRLSDGGTLVWTQREVSRRRHVLFLRCVARLAPEYVRYCCPLGPENTKKY